MSLVGHYRFTERQDGDLAARAEGVDRRRSDVVDLPWTWLNQVHGSTVVTADRSGRQVGAQADAAVTAQAGVALAVQTGDCVPIALLAPGAVGVVHAGWRGLAAGVVMNAVEALRRLSNGPIHAVLGPCIHAECYEFGDEALDALAGQFGDGVRGVTRQGSPALDLPAATTIALSRSGVFSIDDVRCCTSCSSRHWSHRARGDVGRQALVAWMEDDARDARDA